MSRSTALLLTVLLAAPALAAEAAAPAPAAREKAPVKTSRSGEIWQTPLYFTVGAFRDAVDAPVKVVSSVPYLNRLLVAPLLLLNTVTSAVSWSATDEDTEGGVEAWMACMRFERKRQSRRGAPKTIVRRPWWSCYLPNIATGCRILANRPKPDFSSAPVVPLPASAPALPRE